MLKKIGSQARLEVENMLEDNNTFKPYIFLLTKNKKQIKNKKEYNPPRKGKTKKMTYATSKKKDNSFEKKKQKGDVKLIDIVKNKRHNIKNQKQKDEESVNSDKVRKRKSLVDYEKEAELKTKENLLKKKNGKIDSKIDSGIIQSEFKLKPENKDKEKNELKIYDNFELNNMDYDEACENDKRSCLRTYWSVLKREHYVLFTFISRNDYNLFYIKIERFFILICTEMAMNGSATSDASRPKSLIKCEISRFSVSFVI